MGISQKTSRCRILGCRILDDLNGGEMRDPLDRGRLTIRRRAIAVIADRIAPRYHDTNRLEPSLKAIADQNNDFLECNLRNRHHVSNSRNDSILTHRQQVPGGGMWVQIGHSHNCSLGWIVKMSVGIQSDAAELAVSRLTGKTGGQESRASWRSRRAMTPKG